MVCLVMTERVSPLSLREDCYELADVLTSLFRAQLHDTLWFASSIETNFFLSKISGLERINAQQVGKLEANILDRQLIQVRQSPLR